MEMTGKEILISCILVVLFVIFLIYSAFFSKKSKLSNSSMEEFAVGSRSFNFFVVLCTLIGIFLMASVYIGWFSWGMFEGLITQYLLVYGCASFFIMYLFSARIWIWGKNFNLLTQPDFIQLRFRSKPLTRICAVSGILIEAPWCIMEFVALGWLTEAITGGMVDKNIGIIIFGAIVVAYTVYGGMKSVATVEVMKGILVISVVIVGSIAIIYKLFGGFGPMFSQLMEVAPENMTVNYGGTYAYSYWNSIILTGTLGCFGWISMFARIYTAKNVTEVKKSASSGSILMVIVCGLILILAAATHLVPGALDLAVPDMAFFYLCKTAFGPIFLGIAGVLVLATAIGFIGVIISSHGIVISENLIRDIKPNMQENDRRKYSRICIVVYSIICMGIAMFELPNLAHIAIMIYEGVVQIIPLVLFGIFWKRANKWSVGLGYVLGLAVALIVAFLPETFAFFGGWTGGIIGLLVNLAVNIVLGFAMKKEAYVDELFAVVNNYREDVNGNVIQLSSEK